MAKSKSKKSKARPVDDEEIVEQEAPKSKTKSKSASKIGADADDAPAAQSKSKSKAKPKSKAEPAEEAPAKRKTKPKSEVEADDEAEQPKPKSKLKSKIAADEEAAEAFDEEVQEEPVEEALDEEIEAAEEPPANPKSKAKSKVDADEEPVEEALDQETQEEPVEEALDEDIEAAEEPEELPAKPKSKAKSKVDADEEAVEEALDEEVHEEEAAEEALDEEVEAAEDVDEPQMKPRSKAAGKSKIDADDESVEEAAEDALDEEIEEAGDAESAEDALDEEIEEAVDEEAQDVEGEEEELQTKPRTKSRAKTQADEEEAEEAQDAEGDEEEELQTKPKTKSRAKTAAVDDEDEEPDVQKKTKSKSKVRSAGDSDDDLDLDQMKDDDDDLDQMKDDEDEDADQIKSDDDEDDIGAMKADEDDDDDAGTKQEAEKEEGDEMPSIALGPPKAKLSKTAMAFILLNWIMVPTFLYFAYMDYIKRMQYSYRTMLNYVAVWGLPLKMEEDFPSLQNETRPRLKLSAEQLKLAFKERKGLKAVREEFVPVDEPVPFRLRPSDLKPPGHFLDSGATETRVLKDIFWDLPDPVATLEDEIDRLKLALPGEIENAAKDFATEVAKASDEDKRAALRKIYLPISYNVQQVQKLNDTLVAAKGADLDKLVNEGIQRRIYYDILAPLNVYRPSNAEEFNSDKLADLDAYKLDDLKKFLVKRLDALGNEMYTKDFYIQDMAALKRDSVEKRQSIAFLLFTLGELTAPTLDKKTEKKFYPKGLERAQTISGLREFTSASMYYVRARRILEDRIAAAIQADRQGYLLEYKGKLTRTNGMIDEIDAETDRLVGLVFEIEEADNLLASLRKQTKFVQDIYEQRAKQHKEAMDKLLTARATTEEYVRELRKKQEELHEALRQLSDAAERNYALHERIREIELDLLAKMTKKKKGGKKLP